MELYYSSLLFGAQACVKARSLMVMMRGMSMYYEEEEEEQRR